MRWHGRVALHRDVLDQFFHRLLRGHKDQRLPHVALGEHEVQHFELVLVAVTEDQVVFDRIRNGIRLSETDLRRLLQDRVRQLAHALGQRRRVERRLSLGATGAGDALDLRAEPDVEHPVGFVDDQRFQPEHGQAIRVEVVDQAARRRDDQVERRPQRLDLRRERLPAQHTHGLHLLARKDVLGDVPQLLTQLPRGRENDGARSRPRSLGRLRQARQQRQQEGQRLPRARRRRRADVAPLHKRRNGVALHVRGLIQLQACDGVHGTQIQPQ